ncbi:MAG: hypothetical protein ACWGOX_14910, partial [Desulforhopalus sp.]
RTGLGTVGHPGIEVVARCASRMAEILGWNDTEKKRQIAAADRRYIYL